MLLLIAAPPSVARFAERDRHRRDQRLHEVGLVARRYVMSVRKPFDLSSADAASPDAP